MSERTWFRPGKENEVRALMIEYESKRDYEGAALAALAYADYVSTRTAEGAASFERQALVYATLYQATTAAWIADNR